MLVSSGIDPVAVKFEWPLLDGLPPPTAPWPQLLEECPFLKDVLTVDSSSLESSTSAASSSTNWMSSLDDCPALLGVNGPAVFLGLFLDAMFWNTVFWIVFSNIQYFEMYFQMYTIFGLYSQIYSIFECIFKCILFECILILGLTVTRIDGMDCIKNCGQVGVAKDSDDLTWSRIGVDSLMDALVASDLKRNCN